MFYLKGIPLCFRALNHDDIKNSYYNLMGLLSNENIHLISTLTTNELFNRLNDDIKIFVISNLNTHTIIGTCSINIYNKNGLYTICTIQDIIIDTNYNKNGLYQIFLDNLIDYCCITERCVKYTICNKNNIL